ncbi:MAG: hypothetical protein AAF585_17030, partial [Verrucomicrobiota bacterium]
ADRDLVFETVPDTTSNWKVFFTGFKREGGASLSAGVAALGEFQARVAISAAAGGIDHRVSGQHRRA